MAATLLPEGGHARIGHDSNALQRWRDAEMVRGCRHTRNPTPLLGLLARPGVVYCPACMIATAERHVRRNPHSCDECGRRSRLLREVSVLAGPMLTVIGHLCPDCCPDLEQGRPT